ncbi:transglycosylase domain-containing protein [Streptomyces uncialis]
MTQGESPAESTTQLRKHTPKAAAAGAAGTTSAFAATGGPTAPGGPGGSGGGPSGPGGPTGPGGGPAGSGPGDTGGKKAGKAGKGAKGKKAKRPKRKGWRRLVPTWRFTLGSALALLLLAVGAFMTGYLLVEIPAANAAATAQSNVYLYADGSQLARDGEVNRENVQLSQIPEDVQRTVLAAEDRDFHSQSAVDPKAMLRAGWNTATGKGKQSGSTITQQYVKNYYLAQEQTVSRKAKEFFIAIKLDREETKEDILEGYLNTSFFGRNAYGIQSAAQAYYGVDVEKLTIEQGAYLASLLNAPSAYDVVAYPQNKGQVVSRWNYVLDGMVKEGWLASEKREAMKFPMPIEAKGPSGMSGQRGYLVQAVKDYLFEHDIISEEMLNVGGHRITTTLQKPKQDAFVKAVDDQLMARVDKEARKVDRNVRAGGASIDPATGHVVAMYGGIDYTKQYVNNATRRDYQVGSTFKPFVFTTAAEHDSVTQDGRPVTPNTVYDGTSERPVVGWNGGRYAPQNQDQVSYGPVTVQEATDKSVNSVYVQMAVDVGSDKVKQTAIDLGMPKDTRDLHPTPSVALGTATASVLDMAETYATLANHGKHGDPVMVMKLTKDGKEIALPKRQTKQVISREAADTTTSVLRNVVENGSGRAALAAERPAAGKTGTAEQDKAAWFAAYTPELATVVSVMGQDPDSGKQQPLFGALGEPRISGSGPPAEIWAQYTKAALAGTETQEFELRVQDGSDRRLELPGTEPSGTPDSTDGSPDPGSSSPSGDDGEQEQPGGSDTPSTTTGSGSSGGGQSPGQGQSPDPGEGGAEGTVEGQSGGTPGPGATEGTSGDSSGGGPGPGEGGETGGEETGGTGETTGETTGTPTGGASPGLPTTQ